MITLRAGSATDVGLVRANNQDQALVAAPLFAVADGMGGHAAGEVASALACEALGEAFAAGRGTSEDLLIAAQEANRAVYERAQANPEMHGMGTTLVAVALTDDDHHESLAVAHVGDSRVYLLRHGELSQVTADHSLVAELVAEGQIAAEEAERHPQRHVLSRALGVYPSVEVDLTVVDPVAEDRYLLCSDGLSREVTDDQIASVLRRLADPNEAAHELVEAAKARGGADNITVVIVDISDEPARAASPEGLAPAGTEAGGVIPPAPGDDPDATRTVSPGDATAAIPAVRDAPEGPSLRQKRRVAKAAHGPKQRLITIRVVLFIIALLAVVAIVIGGITWYARSSYYVGLSGNNLVIYQGRPGGVLWIKPTVASRTSVTTAQIEQRHISTLKAGMTESSLAAAHQYVTNLVTEEQTAKQQGGPGSTTPTTPSTTVAPGGATAPTTSTTIGAGGGSAP